MLLGIAVGEGLLAFLDSYPANRALVELRADGRGNLTLDLRGPGGEATSVTVTRVAPPRTRRVLLVGDGTLHGGAARPTSTIDVFLQRRLHERLGGLWEVVNLGVPGLSSRQARQVAELAMEELGPEFLVLYVGHDEFLPTHTAPFVDRFERPLLSRLLAPWQFLRVGRAAQRALLDAPRSAESWQLLRRPPPLLERSRLRPVREALLAHYEQQLGELCEEARERHVKLILVEPASNSREFGPVLSAASRSLSPKALGSYRRELERVEELLASGKMAAAQERLTGLEEVDPAVAQLLHLRAGVAWRGGQRAEARRLERRGLGFDELPQAASEALVQRLHTVADIEKLERALISPHVERPTLPGEPAIFLDQALPSVYGQYLFACLLAAAIDPEREDPLEPFPEELEARLADFERMCARFRISREAVDQVELRRLHGLLERAAIAAAPDALLARARPLLAAWPAAQEAPDEAALVLALIEGDGEELSRRERELAARSPARHRRLLELIRQHPRLGGLWFAARE